MNNGPSSTKRNKIAEIFAMPTLLGFICFEVGSLICRNYIANNYEAIRTSPATVTVRECEYVSPTVIATYSFGIEKKIDLTKRPESEIEKAIADLEANS